MARIVIETKKKIDNIYKIQQDIYEIPNSIFRKGYLMYWDSRRQAYIGTASCLSGVDYVMEKLQNNKIEEEME